MPHSPPKQLSVLHWWTSGGESKAIRVLKDDMNKQGYEWKDFAIAGGAGAAAMTALKTQVIVGQRTVGRADQGAADSGLGRSGGAGQYRSVRDRLESAYASANQTAP